MIRKKWTDGEPVLSVETEDESHKALPLGLPIEVGPAGAFEQDVAFSSTVFRRRNILRANAGSNAAAPRAGSVGRRFGASSGNCC